jgi:hypothetical protein
MIPKGLEKQINILDFSLSSLWRRKLKNIGIMLVFSAVIFLLASFQMLTGALSDAAFPWHISKSCQKFSEYVKLCRAYGGIILMSPTWPITLSWLLIPRRCPWATNLI